MGSNPHIVCISYPMGGHVNPFMQLAKLLHSSGCYITFVNTEYYHERVLQAKGPDALKGLDDFRFETIPDGLPPSNLDAPQDPIALCDSMRKNCAAPLINLVKKLNSSLQVPQVSCIISDGIMSFAVQAAQKLGISEVQFWTASACGMMGYLQYRELIKRGFIPLKDESYLTNGYLDTPIDWIPGMHISYLTNGYLDTPIDWIPGMQNMRLKDIPSFIRTTDPNDILLDFMGEETQNCLNSSAIILNTFDDLEFEVLGAISAMFPNIYTMGHIPMLNSHFPESKLKSVVSATIWNENPDCITWLAERSPSSVVYVNIGTVAVLSNQQLMEFAWGLTNSKHPFLWIIRPDVLMGDSASLPKEFIDMTKNQGMIATWCHQNQVLAHPSVGGFLTHCGWNSTMESICNGVPLICWPFFADQYTNCLYACTVWEIGMEIDNNVKREEVELAVKKLLEGEKGRNMKKNALKWKERVESATKQDGSSYKNIHKFIKEVLFE